MGRRVSLALLLVCACVAWPAAAHGQTTSAIDGDGMWVWYVSKSDRGNVDRIAARAKATGIETVFVKAADSSNRWPQFSTRLVNALKARGLRVCAWQFVYGSRPKREADRGADAVRRGAECLVIDAEGHYSGKYVAAQSYLNRLRAKIGADYPLALSSFPYVHFHPSFPYSVFLGPNGAQFNLPQMYWKTIGVSVDRIYQVAYRYNRIYQRPLRPFGQTYLNPSSRDVKRFRALATSYGSPSVSWWVWQFTRAAQFRALTSIPPFLLAALDPGWPPLKKGYKSDIVVWAQQKLIGAGLLARATGRFDTAMQNAVFQFQLLRGLPQTGQVDAATWPQLLTMPTPVVKWRTRTHDAVVARATQPEPLNATLPARRNELRGPRSPRGSERSPSGR